MSEKQTNTQKLVLAAILTALVIVFQLLATFTAFFGPFSTAIALVPIVIGAAMCGAGVGAWLGFVFGIVVLASGGANLFLAFSVHGTIITVLAKGAACGLFAGLVYAVLNKINRYYAVISSALICPVVNTGVFLLGCRLFFFGHSAEIANVLTTSQTGWALFWAMAMGNFIFEIGMSVVLSPVIVRLLDVAKKKK